MLRCAAWWDCTVGQSGCFHEDSVIPHYIEFGQYITIWPMVARHENQVHEGHGSIACLAESQTVRSIDQPVVLYYCQTQTGLDTVGCGLYTWLVCTSD